jgi:YggT family protein
VVTTLIQIIYFLVDITIWVIIGQGILSWLIAFNVVNLSNEFVRQLAQVLNAITEPLYRPLRKLIPPVGQVDLTPMAAIIILIIVQIVLRNLSYGLI